MLSSLLQPGVPLILQSEAPECGIACLAMVASYHGHRTDLSAMRLRLSPSLKGVTLKHVAQIAETMGMTARGVQVPLESLNKLRLPAILHWDMNHFVVLTRVDGRRSRPSGFEHGSTRHWNGWKRLACRRCIHWKTMLTDDSSSPWMPPISRTRLGVVRREVAG